MPRAEDEALIAEIYRGILDREPDAEGLRHHSDALFSGRRVAEVLRGFLASNEFAERHGLRIPAMPAHYAAPMPVELALSPAQMNRLWAHVGATWATLGHIEPFWSVISAPAYQLANMSAAAVEAFYRTGQQDLDRIDAWLRRSGFALRSDMVCAELGCGVGRVSVWLAQRCRQLRAFDNSAPHLAQAEARLRASGIGNAALHLLRTPSDLSRLAGVDLFVSFIVLQHNPPPVMALLLERAFANLAPGGLALFQLPTYRQDYSFLLETYLSGLGQGGGIEMHCLPQQAVFAIAAQHGLTPLEVEQDLLIGDWGISHTFLFRKGSQASR